MKKISLVLLVAITLISCKLDTQVDYAIVSGKVTNLESGEISIGTLEGEIISTPKLADDGSFIDTLRVKASSYYIADQNRNRIPVYIDKGVKINVVYDSKDYKNTIKISGEGIEISKYLLAKEFKMAALFDFSVSNPYRLKPADYLVKMQLFKKDCEALLYASKGIPEDFKALEKRNINTAYVTFLTQYNWSNRDLELPKDFVDEMENIDFNNKADYEFSAYYRVYLSNYCSQKAYGFEKSGAVAKDMGVFKVIEEFTNDYIKNKLLFDNCAVAIVRTPDLNAYYDAFMRFSTSEEHRESMTKIYNELKALSKGQPSPKFIAYENVNGGTTSLDDLKGKYVFIDLWATWCAPCVKEIPFLKKLEEEYHGKNIVFVGISLNDQKDHDKWKRLIQKKELGGIQLLADKALESDFAKAYKVFTIPRFIVLDPDGNIVSSNAPYPSNPKLKELLNSLPL